jgi:apolipoprotein N-acyltransferase
MKNKKKFMTQAGWLLMGLAMLFLSGGDQPVWIAVWLAPAFLLRFFRDTHILKAVLILLPSWVIVDLLADRGMTPFPSFKILLYYTTVGIGFAFLPYLVDRIFRHWLPAGLRIFLFPSLAIAIPFLIGGYGTWGAKANGLEDLALLQLVSVTGTAGISFLIYLTASALNEIWEQRKKPKLVRNLSVSMLLVLVLVYGFGLARLRSNYKPEKFMLAAGIVHDPSLREELISAFTRLVRSNTENPGETDDIRQSMKTMFSKLLSDSAALAESGVEIAVWCEGAVLIFDEDEREMLRLAAEKAREKNIYLGISMAVYQSRNRSKKPGIRPLFKNKLILISPEGKIEWEYAKGILVPGMEAAITIPGDRIMKTTQGSPKISGAICYELDFPRHIRQAARLNAELLLGPSNDWEAIKNTHARMARLRSIETGISLFRPANGGVSVAVDPYGRILAQVDNTIYQGAPLTTVVPLTPIPTIFSSLGNYFNWISVILFLACFSLGIMFRLRKNVKPLEKK